MFLLELNPLQLAYVTELMDRVASTPQDKILLHAAIRTQLANPQLADKVVTELQQRGYQEGFSAAQAQSAQSPIAPVPTPMTSAPLMQA